MFYDILRESPAFQEMAREGRAEGLAEGRAEGRAEGLNTLRQVAADVVATRFSNADLAAEALQILTGIDDVQTLQRATIHLAIALTPEAARQVLTDLR